MYRKERGIHHRVICLSRMFCIGKIPAFAFANTLKFGQTVLQREWKETRVLDPLKQGLSLSLSQSYGQSFSLI